MNEFAPIFFGLLSAASWGAGDFSGGMATKCTHVYGVVIASQFVGMMLLTILALIFSETIPPLDHLLWGALGGIFGAIGLVALYRALASGQMGIAAPVAAVVTAIVPVVFGIFTEGLPGISTLIGFGLALIAVWFVSQSEDSSINLSTLRLPLVAGLGFGFFLIFIDRASDAAIFWPLVAARAASLTMLLAIATLTRQNRLPEKPVLPLTALAGGLDAGGNTFFALAGQVGRLDVASVLSSLYPASTILLAWLILKERIGFRQRIGIVTALAAIVLIAI